MKPRDQNTTARPAAHTTVHPLTSPTMSPTLSPIESPIDSPIESPIDSPIDSPTDSPLKGSTENLIKEPIENSLYVHFKGLPYRFHSIARHSETLEEYVYYESLYENKNGRLWVRPKEMFFESIEREGQSMQRFRPRASSIEFITSPAQILEKITTIASKIFPDFNPVKFKQKLSDRKENILLVYRTEALKKKNGGARELSGNKPSAGDPSGIEKGQVDFSERELLEIGFKYAYQKNDHSPHSTSSSVSPAVGERNLHSSLGGVLPEYRTMGIATELIKSLESWGLENNYGSVTTNSRNQYPAMMRLNLANGYQIIGFEAKEEKILFKKQLK